MRRIFVDTGAFVALRNASEREHKRARLALEELTSKRVPLFTSNYVFAETYTVLLMRVGWNAAVAWGRALRDGSLVELIRIDEALEDRAWSILEAHDDKRWSYVDATSFALMDQEGASEAFSFDRDFVQRGLSVIPG
ncbi:MAG: type II toxin-antitoxin system VapC family toxin [Actinomycetota bacterium]